MKYRASRLTLSAIFTALLVLPSMVSADVVFVLDENDPGITTGATILNSLGTVTKTTSGETSGNYGNLYTVDYAIAGLDLTSEGGTSSETVNFQVAFQATTTGDLAEIVARGSGGNLGVRSTTGGIAESGNNDDIRNVNGRAEGMSIATSLVSTSFGGDIALDGFSFTRLQGNSDGTDNLYINGSTTAVSGNTNFQTATDGLSSYSFLTDPNDGSATRVAFQDFRFNFTATQSIPVPEPTTCSLLGLVSIGVVMRRKR